MSIPVIFLTPSTNSGVGTRWPFRVADTSDSCIPRRPASQVWVLSCVASQTRTARRASVRLLMNQESRRFSKSPSRTFLTHQQDFLISRQVLANTALTSKLWGLMSADDVRKRLAARLAQILLDHHTSPADLDRLKIIDQGQMSRVLRAKKPGASLDMLVSLAEHFHVDITELFGPPTVPVAGKTPTRTGSDQPRQGTGVLPLLSEVPPDAAQTGQFTTQDAINELERLSGIFPKLVTALKRDARVVRRRPHVGKVSARAAKAPGKRRAHQRGA
jgi:hypothetical protein